jgi:hypothetical protein
MAVGKKLSLECTNCRAHEHCLDPLIPVEAVQECLRKTPLFQLLLREVKYLD